MTNSAPRLDLVDRARGAVTQTQPKKLDMSEHPAISNSMALLVEAQRHREFADGLREEAVGLWAEDYLALADLEDAKADAIEASITAAKVKEKDKW